MAFTKCPRFFVTNFVTLIQNYGIHVTNFVTKTFLYDPKNFLADNENYLADNENYLADSGARNGLLGEGVGKDVCRKCGQLSQEMDDQFQDKTQPVISDGFEMPTIHSQSV